MAATFDVPRRQWGNTGIEIPVIPMGTSTLGSMFGPVEEEDGFALVRRAIDIGVNHLDCSACYGDSLSKIEKALKSGLFRRDEVILTGRICGHGKKPVDYSADRAVSEIERQLDLLGIDHYDAVFIHDPVEIDPTLAKEGLLAGLHRLKDRGRVRNVGYGMYPHAFHLKTIESGEVDVLLTFNDFFPELQRSLIYPLFERFVQFPELSLS